MLATLANGSVPNSVVRLMGYKTAGYTDGAFWNGGFPPEVGTALNSELFVVVIGTSTYKSVDGGTNTCFVVVPLSTVRVGLKFSQYKAMKAEPAKG